MTLAVVEQPAALDVAHWTDVLTFAARMADAVHETEFVPTALRGRREAVAAVIIYGAEVGVTPMQALSGIHIVDGRPAPSAELMRAMILRAGHSLMVHEMSGTRARVSGLRRGRPEAERVPVEWTLDMARAAGLLGRQNWQRYPRAMLLARATGDLARLLFADVVKGLGYVAEDTTDVDALPLIAGPEPGEPREAPRKPLQRRTQAPSPRPVESVDLPPREPQSADPAPVAPSDEPGIGEPAPRGYDDDDQPLPDDLQPVGTGRPIMPDLEPEQPADERPAPGMAEPAFKAMHAGLSRELGSAATSEDRHLLLGAILGREVESSKTLTRDEGYRALSALDAFRDGEAAWEWRDGGHSIIVFDLREPTL